MGYQHDIQRAQSAAEDTLATLRRVHKQRKAASLFIATLQRKQMARELRQLEHRAGVLVAGLARQEHA